MQNNSLKNNIFVMLIFVGAINVVSAQTECQNAKVQATLDFEKSLYSLHSEEMLPVEQTYFYVLSHYYNIDWYFTDSLDYYECYDAQMIVLLKTKYGNEFLNRVAFLTDSLNKTENWTKEPEFPGGQKAVQKYISTKLIQSGASRSDFKGIAYVQLIILPNGKVTNPQIIRGVNAEIDRKILRIIKDMPQWKPAYLYGKPVKQRYMIPIKIE